MKASRTWYTVMAVKYLKKKYINDNDIIIFIFIILVGGWVRVLHLISTEHTSRVGVELVLTTKGVTFSYIAIHIMMNPLGILNEHSLMIHS